MPNLPISGLTASASNAAATDVLPVVQTTGTGPVKMTVQQMAGGLLGSTTLSGATITADAPVLNMSQTWNNGAVTFTGLKFNATDTASNAASLLMDLQRGTVSQLSIRRDGRIQGNSVNPYIQLDNAIGAELSYSTSRIINGGNGISVYSSSAPRVDITTSGNITTQPNGRFSFNSTADSISTPDTILTRRAAANLRLGAADAAGSAISVSSVASNQLTLASSHGLTSGAAVIITGTTAPSGTSLNTLYYARSISAAVLELYLTFDTATATSGTTGIVAVTTAGTSASIRLATPFQRLSPQDFTGTDIPGQPLLINGSRGTGTGPGGSIIFQVAPAGTTGTPQNALATALTINSAQQLLFQNGSASSPAIAFSSSTNNGLYQNASNQLIFSNAGVAKVLFGAGFLVSSDGVMGFRNNTNVDGATTDLILARDAANTLALRNGANAQLFRVYSTFNGTNDAYGAIGAAVNLDGTAGDANTLYIGSQKKGSPTALTKLAIQVDGTTRLDYNIGNANQWFFATTVNVGGNLLANDLRAIATGSIYWNTRSQMTSPANGDIKISNLAETDFGRLMFGGITSSFPALKRVSANLQVIAADGTSSAGLIVGNQALATAATDGFLYVPTCAGTPTGTPTTQTGTVPIVVDTTNNKLYFYSNAAWRDAGP